MPIMTGRPGHRAMEMNGGSSAPYLARTPCVPLFSTLVNRGGNRRSFRLPGAGGGSFPLCSGTFVRSYSVSIEGFLEASLNQVLRRRLLSVSNPFKTSAKRKRDRGRDSQPRPRPRLKSQPQGVTK